MTGAFTYTRIVADERGESRISRGACRMGSQVFAPPAPALDVSDPLPASGLMVLRFPPDWLGGWHPSPYRQWGFMLSGAIEVTASDGTTCELRAGDSVLLEDTHGKGHLTRVLGDTEVWWVSARIPAGAAPPAG